MDQIIQLAKENWAVIQPAIWQFVTMGIVLFGIGWASGRNSVATQVSNKQGELDLANARVADYERKLSGASPDEAIARITALEKEIEGLRAYGLSAGRAAAMLAVLEATPGFGLVVALEVSASDARHLFDQVCGLLGQARWNITPRNGINGIANPPDCGVTLLRRPDSVADVVAALRKALNAAHLDFEERERPAASAGDSVPIVVFSSRDPNYKPAARWS